MQHKFKIIKSDAGFRVQFLYNKEVIFWTETYKGKPSAKKAIESIKTKGMNAETIEEDMTTKALAAAKAAATAAASAEPDGGDAGSDAEQLSQPGSLLIYY